MSLTCPADIESRWNSFKIRSVMLCNSLYNGGRRHCRRFSTKRHGGCQYDADDKRRKRQEEFESLRHCCDVSGYNYCFSKLMLKGGGIFQCWWCCMRCIWLTRVRHSGEPSRLSVTFTLLPPTAWSISGTVSRGRPWTGSTTRCGTTGNVWLTILIRCD